MSGSDMTIGQYLPMDTPLHRIDPRLKFACVLAGTVMTFLYDSGWQILCFTALLIAVLLLDRLPVIPLVKSLRAVWVIVLVTFLLQAFLSPGEVLWRWGFVSITDTGLYNGLVFSTRIILLVILLSALTMTTSPLRLADGLESILKPLALLRVPVGKVTTVISITLMFIPGILDQSSKVVRAQMARGADFESANVLKRVKDVVPVLIPLFVKVFKDADELAVAMDARAYAGGVGRTRLYPLELHAGEVLLTVLFISLAVAARFLP